MKAITIRWEHDEDFNTNGKIAWTIDAENCCIDEATFVTTSDSSWIDVMHDIDERGREFDIMVFSYDGHLVAHHNAEDDAIKDEIKNILSGD